MNNREGIVVCCNLLDALNCLLVCILVHKDIQCVCVLILVCLLYTWLFQCTYSNAVNILQLFQRFVNTFGCENCAILIEQDSNNSATCKIIHEMSLDQANYKNSFEI